MNWVIITSIAAIIATIAVLYREKWRVKHIVSATLALTFALLFSVYGDALITPLWKGANASTLWIIMFFTIYVGGAIAGTIPFLIVDGFRRITLRKFKHFLKIFLIAGIIYTIADNTLYGPFAVGTHSPYEGRDLCHLDATYVAEDVFFGCQIERLGINPFTEIAADIVYFWTSLVLGLFVLWWIGAKRLEKALFEL